MKHKQRHPPRPSKPPAKPHPPAAAALLDRQLQQAMAHHRDGELPQAEALYRQILETAPNHVHALYLLSVIASQSGQHAAAVELLDQAILSNPNIAEHHAARADALTALEQHHAALESLDRALRLKPDLVDTHCERGNLLCVLQRHPEAVESYDRAIQLNPELVRAHCNRGIALNALGQYQAAIASFDQALLLWPVYSEAHLHCGIALYSLGQYQMAIASLDRAILHRPDYAEAYSVRGSALNELHQDQAAVESFDRAIQLNPNDATAHGNRANALLVLRQYRAAIESCDRAIQLNPGFVEVWANRGNAFYALGQYQRAQQDYNESIRLKPDYAEAWNNLGAVLDELPQRQAALDAIDRSIQLQPNVAKAYLNRGNVLMHLKQYPLALENFTHALRLNPACDYVAGLRLHVKRDLCDWEDLEAECRQLEARVERNQRATAPFPALALIGSPALQRKAAEIYVRHSYPAPAHPAPIPRRTERDKIRIGYFSADFHQHAVCAQMIDVLEQHDHSQFEIIGFAFGLEIEDDMTRRVSAAMDRFIDVRSLTDLEVAELSRTLEVDIAVDLMVYTEHGRPGIFAQRAAPIQVNYLGYPGTSGADFIDYLIADSTLVPEASRSHYSEKIVTMPDSFQANSRNPISQVQYTRSDQGLPEQGFIFSCFNNSYKIGPATFAVWMRILKQVEGSVLWLLAGDPLVETNLRRQAAQRGIAPERLFFAQRLPLAEHLSRLRVADLFLDTLPFNAGASASPALWAGLPVLTCIGETFAGRMGASLLRAIGLPELVAETAAAYEALAVELAQNPARLRQLREKLDRNRLTTPLFDTPRFTRNLEAAYSAMLQRCHAGLPPDHIHIGGPTQAEESKPPIELCEGDAETMCILSGMACQSGQLGFALELADKAILRKPGFAEAHAARGDVLSRLQQHQAAVESFDAAIRVRPGFAEAWCNRGNALFALHQCQAAVESFDAAIRIKPDFAEAYSNRGTVLQELGDLQAAVESFDRAILLRPDLADAWNNRGNARSGLRQYQAALEDCEQAVRLNPDLLEAHNNRGSALFGLHRDEAAIAAFDEAIRLVPDRAQAWCNRGAALGRLGKFREAVESMDRAVLLEPGNASAYSNRGHVLNEFGRYPDAVKSFDQALRLMPDREYQRGTRLYCKRLMCDWENDEELCRELEAAVERTERATTPFDILAVSGSAALAKRAAAIYALDKYPFTADAPVRHARHSRIRIGYYSADFRDHAVSNLMAGVFERHDRSRFEILGFSFSSTAPDAMTERIAAAMDRFVDVAGRSESEAARLSRELEIDVAVDLMGFTRMCRTGIFAERAAPVQVNYLGYPGTMGVDFMDYLIADETLLPEASRDFYTEKIVYLPNTFQATDSTVAPSAHPVNRDAEGLPAKGFVFCCFNSSYKISPAIFSVWMRILGWVEGSVLWLLEDNEWVAANLRKEAARRGIAPERLVFAKRVSLPEHLARQRLADLFLDTLPFNAGASASPALWAGLPVLTCFGETFASRMGASLLRAIDLPELVTETEAAYEALAVGLALNPNRLRDLREKLDRNRLTTPLFDTARFTRNLEAAYSAMLQRYHAGLPPDHIRV